MGEYLGYLGGKSMNIQKIINNLKLNEEDKKYLTNYLEGYEEWWGEINSIRELFNICECSFCEDVNDDTSNSNFKDLKESLRYVERYVRILKALEEV